jgi:hypothetical protein
MEHSQLILFIPKYLKVTNNLVKCVIFFIYSAYSDKIERTCYLPAETASLTAKR